MNVLNSAAAMLCAIGLASSPLIAATCEPGKGYVAADVSEQITSKFARGIADIGVKTIIRYYDHENETLPGKTLTSRELNIIADAGLNVAVIFQHHNDRVETFLTKGRGQQDASRSLELALKFSQPKGSAIYFGVDGVDELYYDMVKRGKATGEGGTAGGFIENHVTRYFSEVNRVLAGSGYKVGAYGSGAVCDHLLKNELVDYCWLANAKGWSGYRNFEDFKRWVLKQHLTTKRGQCFGTEVDLNTGNERFADFGQWKPKS